MSIAQRLTQVGFLPVLLLLFLAIQIPFLQADPHVDIAPTSRDAFTDEGLNTSQVINRVNHGEWIVDECDNLIKTPLFSLWLYPAYAMFGTSTFVGRLWVLCGCLLLLYFASQKHEYLKWILGAFVIFSLSQFHLFQYIRFTMAELTACFLILVAMAYSIRFSEEEKIWDIVCAGLFLIAAVFVKNQFAYVIILLPVWILCIQFIHKKIFTKKTGILFLSAVITLSFGILLYYLAWYLPTKETYDYVMADQAGGRFLKLSDTIEIRKQAEEFLFSDYVKWYTYFIFLSLVIFIVNLLQSKNKIFKIISFLALVWAVIELHKFGMLFVPARYLSPLLFAWGIFAATQFVWAIKNALDHGIKSRIVALILVFAGILLFVNQSMYINKLFTERSFVMHEANASLSKIQFGNRPIIGPWAPALARETGARVIPVWHNYFNDKDILKKLNPKIIITEVDQGDSGGAFREDGVDLPAIADSVQKIRVGRFDLEIYFMP